MAYQVFVGKLPPALNIDDGRAGAVAAGEAPGVFGVDADAAAREVTLAGEHWVRTGVDRRGSGAAEGLAAGDFVVLGEVLDQLRDVGVAAGLWESVVCKLDLEPGREIHWLVGWVKLGSPLRHRGEFLGGNTGDEWEDDETAISFCEPGARLCLGNEIPDKLWPRNRTGPRRRLGESDGDGDSGSII